MVQLIVSYFIQLALLFLPWHRVGPYFRHGPEAQSVFVTFASAFLVKVNNIFYYVQRLLTGHRNVAATTKILFLSHSRTTG